MPSPKLDAVIRAFLTSTALAPVFSAPAQAQMTVIDPSNLVQNALNAARALEQIRNQVMQITNQIRQLENDSKNLATLGKTFAPDMLGKLGELDALINEARGLALQVTDTRDALTTLYNGDYRGTDVATRARQAAQQLDNARAALQTSLVLQARVTEQLGDDQRILAALADASASATGSLSAQQATNELLAFQAQQTMRLQALLVAQSRADALARAREMEALAQARAQHAHFFAGARAAHPDSPPWN